MPWRHLNINEVMITTEESIPLVFLRFLEHASDLRWVISVLKQQLIEFVLHARLIKLIEAFRQQRVVGCQVRQVDAQCHYLVIK